MNENTRPVNYRRQLKSGSYILIVAVILLAAVIILNLIVAALPTTTTQIDISEKKIYTIGDTTKSVVDKLAEKVEFFYLVEEGKEDVTVSQMLASYASLSDNITVKNVDPAVDPNFAKQYTTDEVKSGSVIVHSEKRSTVVSSSDLYRYSVEGYGEMSYDELNNLYYSFYYGGYSQSGYQFPEYTELFYGEQEFTSAIDYVTTDILPKLCALTGHGETELDNTYKGYISTENYSFESLSLLTSDIPGDTEAVLINVPTSDLTEEEAAKLTEYVKGGGDVIVVTSCDKYTEASMPNLASVLATFGMKAEEGIVLEYDSSHVPSQAPVYFFYGQFGEDSEQSPVSKLDSRNYSVLFGYAHGIVSTDAEGVEFIDVLHTSDDAKIQKASETDASADGADETLADTAEATDTADTADTAEATDTAEAADTEAPETAAAADASASADATGEDTAEAADVVTVDGRATVAAVGHYENGGRVVWYASESITTSDYDIVGGNSAMFIATLNFMSGKTESISIIGKELKLETFTSTETIKTLWTIVLCVAVPVAILVAGLVVWGKRRRR